MNTGAAEVLYTAVGEWAQLDENSIVLDVCCGTGTIGISLAKVTCLLHVKHIKVNKPKRRAKCVCFYYRELRR